MAIRQIAAGTLCLAIVGLRLWQPSVTYDTSSLILTLVVVGLLLLPEFSGLLERVTSFEGNGYKVQLASPQQAAEKLEEIGEVALGKDDADLFGFPKIEDTSPAANEALAKGAHLAALMILAREIEHGVRKMARSHGLPDRGSVATVAQRLADIGEMEPELVGMFKYFWNVRNTAVHSLDFSPGIREWDSIIHTAKRLHHRVTYISC